MNPPTKTTTEASEQRIPRIWPWMLLLLVAGGVLGWLVPESEAWLKPIGGAGPGGLERATGLFERLMEALLAPLVIMTLIGWSTQVVWSARARRPSIKRGTWRVAKLALVSVACFTLASTAAMLIGMATANWVHPVKIDSDTTAKNGEPKASGARDAKGTCGSYEPECKAANAYWTSAQTTTTSEPAGKDSAQSALNDLRDQVGEFLQNLIPTSIFEAVLKNEILEILLLSVLMGMTIGVVGGRYQVAWVKKFANTGAAVFYKLVDYAMYVAPVGVGAATVVAFGETKSRLIKSASSSIPLRGYILALYGALLVFLLSLIGLMIFILHRTKDKETREALYDWKKVLRAILEPGLLAFATATSKAALPRAMQALTRLGIPTRVVSFVIPAGFSLNLAGSALFVSFAATVLDQVSKTGQERVQPLGVTQLLLVLTLTLLSKKIVGVPGASFCVLIALLDRPYSLISGSNEQAVTEALCALACIDMIMDMGRTCINVIGNCIVTVLVAVIFDRGTAERVTDDGASAPATQS